MWEGIGRNNEGCPWYFISSSSEGSRGEGDDWNQEVAVTTAIMVRESFLEGSVAFGGGT